ncbi:hypothetical protein SAMN04488120_105212 [Fontimonas thermophila]|uniref:Uncharacterized protein n=1 Tax=Fontimonas thermophila TaxID=1076937 RepID=A0A1I2J5R7_9GAMM|nr:hypothetical protein [Fontimonas thermophila]SFF49360.1 hypothetical protein SAMN04488120_105212 [Fontimonas thermophila]
MSADWLLADSLLLRVLALAVVVLPAVLILACRRTPWWSRLLWAVSTQLPWAFIALYLGVWRARYAETTAPAPLAEAVGWWTLAFPWAVYLLYRATRRRFSGERH